MNGEEFIPRTRSLLWLSCTSIYINTDLAAVDMANRLVLDAVFGNG